MRKKDNHTERVDEQDTMRTEYDFSGAVRGVTASRYIEGTNIVVVERNILDVFPDSASVNEVLKALAPVLRHQRKAMAISTIV